MEIRLLTPDDAEMYWPFRLQALKDHPEAFGASYEESVNKSLDYVKQRLQPSEWSWILGAFDENGRIVGMVGLYRETWMKMKHKAKIWGMYVVPEMRSKGVGRQLLHEAITRAISCKEIEQVQLTVVTSNFAARSLYKSVGFQPFALEKNALKVNGRYFDEESMVLEL